LARGAAASGGTGARAGLPAQAATSAAPEATKTLAESQKYRAPCGIAFSVAPRRSPA